MAKRRLITAAADASKTVGVPQAARAFGIPRSTLYRHTSPPRPRPATVRRPQPRALKPAEKDKVLAVLNSDRFVDKAPKAIHAKLLEEGEYLCSPRTMYRLLASQKMVRQRRQASARPRFERPELLATGPNKVWTWDVTWLRGPAKGERYALYIMLDLFSRYVVGWMLAHAENAELAEGFIDECYRSQGVVAGELTVHSDRGSAQTSEKVRKLTDKLQVSRSYSRPRVCNDNPFSEAINKTLKYSLDFPNRFAGFEDARDFCRGFFDWYNREHVHSGIAMLSPAVVHRGEHHHVIERRQHALDQAYAEHPERFVHGPPKTGQLPAAVYLNKPNLTHESEAHYS